MDIMEHAWRSLAVAVVAQQALDYREALRACRKNGSWSHRAQSLRKWFFSDWAFLLAGCDMDTMQATVERLEAEEGWDYKAGKPCTRQKRQGTPIIHHIRTH